MLTPLRQLDVSLLDGTGAALPQIEVQAERGLRGQKETLVELANSLLQHSPVPRDPRREGCPHPERGLDSAMLVKSVEEARDRLGLPPGDDAGEISY